MFKGLDHVVIAVKDLEASIRNYEQVYGTTVSERREAQGMKAAYFRFEGSYVELVTNDADEGPIARRLSTTGEGVHLIALKVDDIDATVVRLRDAGIRLLGDPGPGQQVVGQIFVHPSVMGGVLTEIVQS
jgi:methylmalonyl-CoA epimerase